MPPSTLGYLAFRVFRAIGWLSVLSMIATGLAVQFGTGTWLERQPGFTRLRDNLPWLVAGLGLAVAGSSAMCRQIGEPRFWATVGHILTGFRDDIFGIGGIEDHDRITLYRFRRWTFRVGCVACRGSKWWPWGCSPTGRRNWPWSGWIVPVVRSGQMGHGKSVFLAKNDQESWGVAGTAFFHGASLEKSELPEASLNRPESITHYAKETFACLGWIEERLKAGESCARCFYAIRVRAGKRAWGVIMIDSRREKLPKSNINTARFRTLAGAIGELLSGR
ncbi:MAG: hypothetical protein WD069_03785 [Planctomycetales bacterium]